MLKRTAKVIVYTLIAAAVLFSLWLNFVAWFNERALAAYQKGAADNQATVIQAIMNEVQKGELNLSNGKETIVIVKKAEYGGNTRK